MSSAAAPRREAHHRPYGILGYHLLYRLGMTPWNTGCVPAELTALVEGPAARPPAEPSTWGVAPAPSPPTSPGAAGTPPA